MFRKWLRMVKLKGKCQQIMSGPCLNPWFRVSEGKIWKSIPLNAVHCTNVCRQTGEKKSRRTLRCANVFLCASVDACDCLNESDPLHRRLAAMQKQRASPPVLQTAGVQDWFCDSPATSLVEAGRVFLSVAFPVLPCGYYRKERGGRGGV